MKTDEKIDKYLGEGRGSFDKLSTSISMMTFNINNEVENITSMLHTFDKEHDTNTLKKSKKMLSKIISYGEDILKICIDEEKKYNKGTPGIAFIKAKR